MTYKPFADFSLGGNVTVTSKPFIGSVILNTAVIRAEAPFDFSIGTTQSCVEAHAQVYPVEATASFLLALNECVGVVPDMYTFCNFVQGYEFQMLSYNLTSSFYHDIQPLACVTY